MKRLSEFMACDAETFFKDKTLQALGGSPWLDFNTKEVLGTKIPVVIIADNTAYKQKEGEVISNAYEKFDVKVKKFNMQIPVNSIVTLVNPVCTVYGDFRNKLSVITDDIVIHYIILH